MPARSQGNAFMQRVAARMERDDIHRWVFVENMAPETESLVRKWLRMRLDGFYCDLQVMYTPHVRLHSAIQARTHIVLHNAPCDAQGRRSRRGGRAWNETRGRCEGDYKSDGVEPAPVGVR